MQKYHNYRKALLNINWSSDFTSLVDEYKTWLGTTGSLTARLKQISKDIYINPIFDGFENKDLDDSCWVREVVIGSDGVDWIFARTLINKTTFQRYKKEITSLKNRFLGEWLFKKPVKRYDLEWGKYAGKFARRSVLCSDGDLFFVSELFLDDFWSAL